MYSGDYFCFDKILCKIRKSAVALWKPWIEKWFISHFKALNVSSYLRYQTLKKGKVTRLLGMMFESGTF